MSCLAPILASVKQCEREIISTSGHIKCPIMGTESSMATAHSSGAHSKKLRWQNKNQTYNLSPELAGH